MRNKVLTLLLSVIIAFGLWVYVITVVNPESEDIYYDIPVVYQNENVLADRGLMITSDTPKVTLRLAGNRADLINLNATNINVLVNLASIEAPGTHLLGYTVSYPGNIASNAVTKQQGSPSMVSLKVENKMKKSVEVAIKYTGAVPEGYIADKEKPTIDNPTIEISGPESAISKIQQAVVEVDLDDQSKTIVGQFPYTLCDEQGKPVDAELVTTNVENVNLTVKIQRVKEVKLRVDVVDGGGATKDTCTIRMDTDKIRVSGSETLLEDMDELLLGTINLGELLKDDEVLFPIVLPEGVTNETGVTEVKVGVQFPNLRTRTFNVTSIMPQNVPEGLEVDMITQALEVTLRGPKELVEAMEESDISVYVDFEGAETGTATMKAYVAVGSEYAQVGAVGNYSVSATLREPTKGR